MACPEGYELNEETCECELIKCMSGWYHNGFGCSACPGNTSSGSGIYDPDVFLGEGCGYGSSNYGANGITDCYQVAKSASVVIGGNSVCKYSDSTGSYEFTNNCPYVN